MFSSYLRISVIFIIFNSVQLAPVDEVKSLFDIVSNDSRADQLKSLKETKYECSKRKEISESLCMALYDVSIKFNEASLNFSQTKNDNNEEFCSKFLNILPDKFKDEATLQNVQKTYRNVSWIKDILTKDTNRCQEECRYESIEDDYKIKVKPVCFFIFNQYQFLAAQSTKKETTALKSGEEIKSSEHNAKTDSKSALTSTDQESVKEVQETVKEVQETVKDFIPILPANAVQAPVAQNENLSRQQIQPPAQQIPSVKSSETSKEIKKEEKTVTPVVVTANKSETAQAKAETPKTESTVNAIDLEQLNLENSPDDKDVFEDTQSDLPEKDIDTNDPNADNMDDDDPDDYSPDLNIRDNNRNGQSNKFNNLPSVDIEQHESEQSRAVRVEKVLDEFEDNPDSNFFTYLCIVMFLSILLYILYHNRHKILALLVEGRRGSRRPRERSRGGSKAAYSKLDCNLEEAITSKKSLSGKSMDIIY